MTKTNVKNKFISLLLVFVIIVSLFASIPSVSAATYSQYGNVRNSGSYKTAKTSSGIVGGYYTSSYFEPQANVKGDIALILLYDYVRWGENNLTDVVQSIDVLLSWCQSDPVDAWEMGRNDSVQGIQGDRNVFIDYPEYSWLIFGKSVPSGMTTPSEKPDHLQAPQLQAPPARHIHL